MSRDVVIALLGRAAVDSNLRKPDVGSRHPEASASDQLGALGSRYFLATLQVENWRLVDNVAQYVALGLCNEHEKFVVVAETLCLPI